MCYILFCKSRSFTIHNCTQLEFCVFRSWYGGEVNSYYCRLPSCQRFQTSLYDTPRTAVYFVPSRSLSLGPRASVSLAFIWKLTTVLYGLKASTSYPYFHRPYHNSCCRNSTENHVWNLVFCAYGVCVCVFVCWQTGWE